jgi:type IV pilus assembly protein PilB
MGNSKRPLQLGEQLMASGLIDQEIIDKALSIQKVNGEKLGKILVSMDAIDQCALAEALANQLGLQYIDLKTTDISPEALSLVPAKIATKFLVMPVRLTDKGLLVAFDDPMAFQNVEELSFIAGKSIITAISPKNAILEAITTHYKVSVTAEEKDLGSSVNTSVEVLQDVRRKADDDNVDIVKLENQAELAPIVRFLNVIVSNAISQRASDIHIEPGQQEVVIRYRIDGMLQEAMKTDPHVLPSLVSRVKIISDMDISIRRTPQDGKVRVLVGQKPYDLRVSTMPTTFGEKVTIRILDSMMADIDLKGLGFTPTNLQLMTEAIDSPQGIVLVTGPTGSGKSSTLYACLNHLKSPEVNIITLEDPVEYDMASVSQVSINLKAGLTFASGLRTILRQDPDIVMIGEIRDSETAEIACKASQTGHFVLSTLHTNDALASINRLMDLGVEPFMISSTIRAVIGQRLVRRLCEHCKSPKEIPDHYARKITSYLKEHVNAAFYTALGCPHCRETGYSGRIAIHEILVMTPEVKEALTPGVSSFQLKKIAREGGYRPILLDGLDKALEGITSIEEIFRVSPPEIEVAEIETRGKKITETFIATLTEPLLNSSASEPAPKILVVDDDAIARKILQVSLQDKGFRIIEAVNGIEALGKVQSDPPDLILTDYMMPEMDGLTLVKTLKNQPHTCDIPIIMLTSKDESESEIELMEAGVDDYLIKPADPKRLLARMGRLLKPKGSNS